ncbi:MAG: hypothetical protein R3190_19435 [Thermoanaerobaculia bacterium]|nr:hypothetical protein [Thermoanaerobaculia bacterium]
MTPERIFGRLVSMATARPRTTLSVAALVVVASLAAAGAGM